MKKIVIASFAVIATVMTSASFAVRTELSDVASVFANATGGGFVVLSSALSTTGAVCSANKRYQINSDGAGAKGHLAALLTAKASGAQIQIDVGSCTITAPAVSPLINNVILY